MMQRLLLWAIEVYQRHLSPHKGFSCAYRCHTGHASCSQLGWRAVRRWGAVGGLQVLRQRLFMCGVAYRRFGPLKPMRRGVYRGPRAAQQGECDIGCDAASCDGPGGGRSGCGPGDALDCLDCSPCDLWDRKKRDRTPTRRKGKGWGDEKYVYIPPASGRRKDEKR